jgi:hypothetical protein
VAASPSSPSRRGISLGGASANGRRSRYGGVRHPFEPSGGLNHMNVASIVDGKSTAIVVEPS